MEQYKGRIITAEDGDNIINEAQAPSLPGRNQDLHPLAQGPLPEEANLMAQEDYYKPTMSQVQYEKHPSARVAFEFQNRDPDLRLGRYIDPDRLHQRLVRIQQTGFQDSEIKFLAQQEQPDGTPLFGGEFLQRLADIKLPDPEVEVDQDQRLQVKAVGEWPAATFWETAVLNNISELYYETLAREGGIDLKETYEEGIRRLDKKVEILKDNPEIKFADFGTRRRFSGRWQRYVLERLQQEVPNQLVGTSNVELARKLDLKPIGTFAHEMPMVYAGLLGETDEALRGSHSQMLQDWYDVYGNQLAIALSDTFGSDFFFEDFTPEQAKQWRGLRHDSGDPFKFGERVVEFYKACGINPKDKTIVFSDGLDIEKIVELHNYFAENINVVFGWGTNLTNDLGVDALNIVMKATWVERNGVMVPTVKFSDVPGKVTGPEEEVERYDPIFRGEN